MDNKVMIERIKELKLQLSSFEQQYKNAQNVLAQTNTGIIGINAIIAEYERLLKEDKKADTLPDTKKEPEKKKGD